MLQKVPPLQVLPLFLALLPLLVLPALLAWPILQLPDDVA